MMTIPQALALGFWVGVIITSVALVLDSLWSRRNKQ